MCMLAIISKTTSIEAKLKKLKLFKRILSEIMLYIKNKNYVQ